MKRIVSIIFVFALMCATAYPQNWTFNKFFPDTSFKVNTGGHGIAVAPDGNIWFVAYGATDSIKTADGTEEQIRVVYCFKPDGSQASFSPIKTLTVNSVVDTFGVNSNRGMREDNNGNILFMSYDILYRINYKTGEGMNKFAYPNGNGGGYGISPGVDAAGDIFLGSVLPGNPINILSSDFTLQGNAVDSTVGYSRTLEVSPDGNTIYWCGYSNNAVFVYNRPDAFSPYTVVDTAMKGFECESIGWNPKTHYLWASSGSNAGGLPNLYPDTTTAYTYPTWYAWDVNTWTIKDSINWKLWSPGDDARPRGIAFSPGGDTAYVTCFGASTYPAIEMFVRKASAVQTQPGNVITSYKLAQNYPNPFNPSTEINYTVAKPGLVTLKVYDMLGRVVATLVNQYKASGHYNVNFNASNLASGMYIYQLNVNGVTISKKMTLLK